MEYAMYTYKGPVCEWGKCISNSWEARTMATSENKARANLIFKFKERFGKGIRTNITLPGKLSVFKKGGNYGGDKVAKTS